MLFDINTSLQNWAFRQIPYTKAADLKAYLQDNGIGKAAVSSNHSVFYMDAQNGNLELAEEIRGFEDFFVPVATLNPAYAAWEKDLNTCAAMGFKALRLIPTYHNYTFDLPELHSIVDLAASLNMPVIFPHELVNFRQRHHMEPQKPFGFQEFVEFVQAHPKTNFIVLGMAMGAEVQLPGNLYVELTRILSAYQNVLAKLIKNIGADHVLYGSGAPFKGVETSLLKLHNADLEGQELELVSHGNAERLLNI